MIGGVSVYGWFVAFVLLLVLVMTVAAVAEVLRDRRGADR